MSTPIVPSITDEQLADLEAFASDSKLNIYRPMGWAHSVRCGNHLQTDHEYLSAVSPDVMLALIARLRAAEKDAARLEWVISEGCIIQHQNGTASPTVFRVYWPALAEQQPEWYPSEREAIDAAMGAQP